MSAAEIDAEDGASDMGSEASVEQRFFGTAIAPGETSTFTLMGTELKISNIAARGEGSSSVFVTTGTLDEQILVATVGDGKTAPRSVLVDLSFFDKDEVVNFKVEGTAEVHLAGSIALFADLPPDSDEEEDEDEEEEEEEQVKEEKVKPAEKKPAAAEQAGSKRKREEEKPAATGGAGATPAPAPAPAAKAARKDGTDASSEAHKTAKGAEKAEKVDKNAPVPLPGTDGKVMFHDSKVGTGPRPSKGDKVIVRYTGTLANGKKFDSSDKFGFKLGVGQVIKGWDVGVASMNVGTKRRLFIHPSYGYGKQGSPPVIPANATLIFDVELVAIK